MSHSFKTDEIKILADAYKLHLKKNSNDKTASKAAADTNERLALKDLLRLIREYLGLRVITSDFILDYLKSRHPDELMKQIEENPDVQEDIMNLQLSFHHMVEILDAKHSRPLSTRQKIIQVFEEFDIDRSGSITTIEVAHIFKRFLGESLTESEIRALVEMIDRSQDEKISLDEWVRFMTQILKKADPF